MAALMAAGVGCMAGCNRKEAVEIDPTKTQRYVQNYNGGFGGAWLDAAAARFTKEYAETCFEPGTDKKGVQIIIDHTKSLDSNLSTSVNSVFFAESLDYVSTAVSGSTTLDITDIVQSAVPGESRTIESKLSSEYQSYLKYVNNKYWALPHYEFYSSLIYDVDLFENEKLYFADDKTDSDFIMTKTQKRSSGPNGVYENNGGDDGLPATIEEFAVLFDYMISKNITPLIWSGANDNYVQKLLRALTASLEGAEGYKANYTFEGTTKIVTDYSTMATDEVEITKQNGYLLSQQESKYEALKFLAEIFSDTANFHKDSWSTLLSHTDAQEAYIYSKLENKPVAMLIESSYWYNEAEAAFARSVEDYGSKAENRRFGYMPLPRIYSGTVTEEIGAEQTIINLSTSYGYINGNIKSNENLVNLAKKFLQYCYSDETMKDFTKTTNAFRPYDYDVESVYNELNYFGKTVWDVKKSSTLVQQFSSVDMYVQNISDIAWSFKSKVGNITYAQPVMAFRSDVSVVDYFKGMQKSESDWTTKYSKYWEN